MASRGRIENLKHGGITAAEAAEMGRRGGLASVEARRKKKLLSKIYGEFLADKYDVVLDGEKTTLSGDEFVRAVIKRVLAKGGAPAVSLLREIREATEGSKIYCEAEIDGISQLTYEETIARIRQIMRDMGDAITGDIDRTPPAGESGAGASIAET